MPIVIGILHCGLY